MNILQKRSVDFLANITPEKYFSFLSFCHTLFTPVSYHYSAELHTNVHTCFVLLLFARWQQHAIIA